MKTDKFKQYVTPEQVFNAFDKSIPIKSALGSKRQKEVQEITEVRSTNFKLNPDGTVAEGWRLTRRGLETVATGVFPPGSVTFVDIQDIATARILGRVAAGSGVIQELTAAQVKTLLAIVSGDISDFVEAAQDAAGAMIADTNTIDLTYTDATPQLKADVRYQDSATIDFSDNGSGLKADIVPAYQRKSLFDHFANAGNTGTGEDDLYSDTIAAGQLATNGDKLEAQYAGTFVSSATATREIRIYFGGTQIFDSGALTLSLSSAWDIFVTVIRESATVVRCSVSMTTEGAALAAYTQYTRITGLTLSGTNVLKITGESAGVGAATDDVQARLGEVEWKSAA